MAFVLKWFSDCFTGPSDQSDECHLLENLPVEKESKESARGQVWSKYAPSNPFFSKMLSAEESFGNDLLMQNTPENVVNVYECPAYPIEFSS